jgi:hypothetical protein
MSLPGIRTCEPSNYASLDRRRSGQGDDLIGLGEARAKVCYCESEAEIKNEF